MIALKWKFRKGKGRMEPTCALRTDEAKVGPAPGPGIKENARNVLSSNFRNKQLFMCNVNLEQTLLLNPASR